MTDNEFLLFDRITKIKSVIKEYGEENFYLSFSGGKDSAVLSALLDMAVPENKIPRVYANTGIELNMIKDFVINLQKTDDRIVIIKPSVPIKKMLENEGYPFKSKLHSKYVHTYQNSGKTLTVKQYLGERDDKEPWQRSCPKCLKYQFTDENTLKISDKCCVRLKEEPVKRWSNEHNKPYGIVGIMRAEDGRRRSAKCVVFTSKGKTLSKFQPLVALTKDWEDWFIEEYNIKICDIYKEPYNFQRTGCKGCPFNIELQKDLDVMEQYFPAERKQCEIIWKPVYDEYRRLGYRLKKADPQMNIFDIYKDVLNK